MPLRHFISLLFSLLLLLTAVTPSAAELRGEVALTYADYQSEAGGEEVVSATSLAQKYSLLWQRGGRFFNGQAGGYELSLGYEYLVLDPTYSLYGVDDPETMRIQTDKLLYKGNVVFAPGGLPFRLHLFAGDSRASTFTNSYTRSLPVGPQPTDNHLIDQEFQGDINNGTHFTFGGVLLIGIRNGSYLGSYRDILSQFPRLMIDYKETENKDLHDGQISGGVHNRERDLAFVSLNKKDNWFHFRMHDYVDYMNPLWNTNKRQVMLGTVDHALQRQWVNLTNWIKISADGGYTEQEFPGQSDDDIIKRYDLNLFSVMRNQTSELTAMSSYWRRLEDQELERELHLPVNFSHDLDRTTRVSGRLVVEQEQTDRLVSDDDQENETLFSEKVQYLALRGELRRNQPYLLRPTLEVENKSQLTTEAVGLALGMEIASNPQQKSPQTLVAGYKFTRVESQGEDIVGESLQNDIYLRMQFPLGTGWSGGYEGSVSYLDGLLQTESTNYISTLGRVQLSGSNRTWLPDDGSTLHWALYARQQFYVEHSGRLLKDRLSLQHSMVRDGDDADQYLLYNLLSYRPAPSTEWSLRSKVLVGAGSALDTNDTIVSLAYKRLERIYLVYDDIVDLSQWHLLEVNRSSGGWHFKGSASYAGTMMDDFDSTAMYGGEETLSYRVMEAGRRGNRPVLEFSETLSYASLSGGEVVADRRSALMGQLKTVWRPKSHLLLGGSVEYALYGPSGAGQLTYSANFGATFQKLEFLLSYKEGIKDYENATYTDVEERSLKVEIKKIF